MTIHEALGPDGVVELTMDNPPVNALNVADAYELAERLDSYVSDPSVHVAILTAAGKGFCAGIDMKEIQGMERGEGILAANHSCFEVFRAVYECAVPVIAAVNGFCLGSGIGLVGNADLVIAANGSVFGLPEVDNGALGALTHLRRLVPQQRARHMLYTCQTASADELLGYGSILEVVRPDELMATVRAVAADIAGKSPRVIRAAKRSANGIDSVDVLASYRYEQGYTFELDLAGEGQRGRAEFLRGERRS